MTRRLQPGRLSLHRPHVPDGPCIAVAWAEPLVDPVSLGRLSPAAGLSKAPMTTGLIGKAGAFAGTHGYRAVPSAPLGCADIAVMALIRPDLRGQGEGTLIAMGGDTGNDSRPPCICYGVALSPGPTDSQLRVHLVATRPGGELAEVTAVVGYQPGRWTLLLVARYGTPQRSGRPAGSDIVIRLGDAVVERFGPAYGELERNSRLPVTIGYREGTAGAIDTPLGGVDMDTVMVFDRFVCAEEYQLYHERLRDHFAAMQRLHRMSEPRSIDGRGVWSTDPDALVRRELDLEADALAGFYTELRDAEQNGLPDRAYGRWLRRWEGVTGQRPGAHDAIDSRRGRVQKFMARVVRYAADEVIDHFVPMLGIALNVRVIGFANLYRATSFSSSATPWLLSEGNGRGLGRSGSLLFTLAAGVRYRWRHRALWVRQTVSVNDRHPVYDGVTVKARFSSASTAPDVFTGIVVEDRRGDALWYGMEDRRLCYRLFDSASQRWGTTTYLTGVMPVPLPLAMRHTTGGAYELLTGNTRDALDSPLDHHATVQTTIAQPRSVYVAAFTTGVVAAEQSVRCEEYLASFPDGRESFHLYLFAQDIGDPDYIGAERILQQIKPAWCEAHVVRTPSLQADRGRLGEAPMT